MKRPHSRPENKRERMSFFAGGKNAASKPALTKIRQSGRLAGGKWPWRGVRERVSDSREAEVWQVAVLSDPNPDIEPEPKKGCEALPRLSKSIKRKGKKRVVDPLREKEKDHRKQ